MNKAKQEMLEQLDKLNEEAANAGCWTIGMDNAYEALRTLITDSVIVTDEEIEGVQIHPRLRSDHEKDNAEFKGYFTKPKSRKPFVNKYQPIPTQENE